MTKTPPGPLEAPVTDRDRTVIYLAILIALFLAALDQTIVATALPQMVEDLQGIDRYAWVATAYLLASTGVALIYGKLADTYSRKYITLGAIALFLVGSVLCGLSGELGNLPLLGDGMTQLVIFRGIQGAGGGGLFAMTFIVIADLFTPAERGKYQGYVGAVFGLASVLGPLIGGLLTDNAGGLIPGVEGWRWVFYVNIPVGAVALWFIGRRMPKLEPPGERQMPDLAGGALLLGGLIPLVMSLQLDKRAYPWTSLVTVGLFAFGAALLTAFVLRSRKVKSPILDMRLFSDPVFRAANASTFFFGASFMSVTIFLPLFLVNVLGVSATRAGAALIPFSMGIVFSATLAGQIVHRIGYRGQIFGGGLVFLMTVVLLARMGPDVPYSLVMLYMILAGLGVGPGMPLFTLAIQNAVDVRLVGQATSAAQFFRQTGATVGAALMGTVLASTLALSFSAIDMPDAWSVRSDATLEELVSTGGADLPARIGSIYAELAAETDTPEEAQAVLAQGTVLSERVATEVRQAFALATSRIYWFTVILVLVATALVLLIPELPLRTTHDRAVLEPTPVPERS
ncbi:MAG: MFS transporter [Gemmatimonadota bacterium]|nr:MFS transporter [Gemmatimonadota bacterium]MDH3422437.1 MFS transporter [Gemmatimonadota bacterium]